MINVFAVHYAKHQSVLKVSYLKTMKFTVRLVMRKNSQQGVVNVKRYANPLYAFFYYSLSSNFISLNQLRIVNSGI